MKKFRTVYYKIGKETRENPLVFAHISDLHGCSYGENQEGLFTALEEIKPDAVMVSGDMMTKKAEVNKKTLLFFEVFVARFKTTSYIDNKIVYFRRYFMAEKIEFKTEVNKLLDIVINSLYSEKYIFLRELISNSSDAIDKLKYLKLVNQDLNLENKAYKITITPNKEDGTLMISDNGIGMDKEDLINHIGTIAKSGTAEFLNNTKDNTSVVDLIGKFGVGFYSAFMVADKVEIRTK